MFRATDLHSPAVISLPGAANRVTDLSLRMTCINPETWDARMSTKISPQAPTSISPKRRRVRKVGWTFELGGAFLGKRTAVSRCASWRARDIAGSASRITSRRLLPDGALFVSPKHASELIDVSLATLPPNLCTPGRRRGGETMREDLAVTAGNEQNAEVAAFRR